MYKLWRRESSKPSTSDINNKKRQAQFVQALSQIIKIIRRKQQFYIRVLFIPICQGPNYMTSPTTQFNYGIHQRNNIRQHTLYVGSTHIETIGVCDGVKQNRQHREVSAGGNIKIHQIQNQLQSIAAEEDEQISNLKSYQQQEFIISKKYLYTMFVRLLEIFDYCRQKISIKTQNQQEIYGKNWEKLYDENKTILTETYQNLVYFQNYNVIELVNTAVKKQNHRIYSIVPLKTKKNQISLKPLIRLNSAELRKAHSIDIKPKKQEKIIEIVHKKINGKQKKLLMTEKRIQQRKKLKQKPITFKALYGILNIKLPKTQEGNAFRRQMQMDALQRNQLIQEQRKKWQKKWETKTYSLKLMATQQKLEQQTQRG